MVKNKISVCPVILAGGGGTRLWPLSREHYPKQFLTLDRELSLLQETLTRLRGLHEDLELLDTLVFCNEDHRFLVQEHMEDNASAGSIILEPQGRNTAPALTCAAILLKLSDPVLLMMPADHLINDINRFYAAILQGVVLAAEDMIVAFGIVPDKPETGYGYVRAGEAFGGESLPDAYQLLEFVEKPDMRIAEEYVSSGKYFWNSGIFMMKASVWEQAIKGFEPEIHAACVAATEAGGRDGDFFRLDRESFLQCPDKSIDYAVMEKICGAETGFKTALVTMDAGWSDVGSWSAVWEVTDKTADKNVFKGDVIAEDTRDSIVYSENKLVATVGINNLLVIETADAVLVGHREKAQDVKKLVNRLKSAGRRELVNHSQVFRPWGSYISIDQGNNFQVKRLIVKPGRKLSLQLHHQRAEHWVVVRGTATVTVGDDTFDLQKNESTYIPIGTKHRLENRGDDLLEIIEVQSGEYLGEDDIVRFEDDFGRK